MRGSADQKNSKYGHFSRGVSLLRHLMRATFTSSVKSIPALDHVLCGRFSCLSYLLLALLLKKVNFIDIVLEK